MKSIRTLIGRLLRRDCLVYGLIEWDSSYTPTLLVGRTRSAVHRAALRTMSSVRSCESESFDLPVPGADSTDADVETWLEAFHEEVTEPWFTYYGDHNDRAAELVFVG